MTNKTHILAFSGSLRKASYNTAMVRLAMEMAPADCEIELVDIGNLPLYNQELDGDNVPPQVIELAKKVLAADAILFSTPEYNYSIPGVLKNAIDWLSRQTPQPFAGKPAAIMSASMSLFGGVRAQHHLRQVMVYLDVHFVNKPEVMIASAHTVFDENGQLTDPKSRDFIQQLVSALVSLSHQLNK